MPTEPTFSASSGVNPFEDALDRVDAKRKAEVTVNPFAESVERLHSEDMGTLASAARWSKNYDPDVAARARKIAPALPVDVGTRQIKTLEDEARLENYRSIFDKAPGIRKVFADNPKDLAYANPDELDHLSGIEWALEAGPAAAADSMQQVRAALASNRIAAGQGTIQDKAFLANYKSGRTFGARDGWWSSALVQTGQQIAPLVGTALHGAIGALEGAVYGGTAGAVAGSVLPGIGTAAGGLAGTVGGARVGGTYGALEFQRQLQTGLNRLRFQEIKDENGAPLEPELVELAARITGLGGAVLEQVALAQFTRVLPGVDRLLGVLKPAGMEAALRTPGIRQALGAFAVNTGRVVGTEIATEVLQEGITILGQELAKQSSERDFTALTTGEIAAELGQAAIQAAQVMSIMGPFAAGTRFGSDLYSMHASKRRNDEVKRAAIQASENKLVERAPDIAAKVIDAQSNGRQVYIPAQEFVELYQSSGQDPFGPPLPNWRDRLQGALDTGGDVQLSLGEFIAHLAKDPKDNPLMDLVRTDPLDYVTAEMREYDEVQDELLGSEISRATASRAELIGPKDTRVQDELKRQAVEAGYAPEAADYYAQVLGAYYETQAAKPGMDTTAAELFAANPLDIQRVMGEAVGDLIENGNEGTLSPATATPADPNLAEAEGVEQEGDPAEEFFQQAFRGMSLEEFDALQAGTYTFQPDQLGMFVAFDERDTAYYTQVPGSGVVTLELSDDLRILDRDDPEFNRIAQEIAPGPNAQTTATHVFPETFRQQLLAAGYQAVRGKSAAIGHDEVLLLDPRAIQGVQSEALGGPTPANRDAFSLLFQEKRGAIAFQKDAGAVIKLFDQADMSTLLHEAGHFFLQTTRDFAARSPEIDADWQIIRKHFGIAESGRITREQHEAFARATEAYFMEGKAPIPELRSAFEAFRRWLITIYRNLRRLGGKVDPEIRGVFDRMLATQDRLSALEQDTAYAPLFKDAESMGLDPQDYLEYQKLVEDLRAQAQEGTMSRIVNQTRKLGKGWRGQIEKQLTREAEERLKNLPPYNHLATLRTSGFAINPEEFRAKYGKEAVQKFPRQAFKTNGLAPDIAAELLGYPTADEMVYDFVQAAPLKEAAKAEAKAEMVKRFGENFDDSAVMDLAIKRAMAEEGRVLLLAKEYQALSKKNGRTVSEQGPKQLAEQIARNALYGRKFKDVNERQAQAAARRAGTMAESAALKGDWAKAADWKRKQILAQALDNQTQELNRAVEKIRDKAARYTRTKGQKGMDPATMEKIKELVTQYEFARIPLRKIAKRESLREYLDRAEAEGFVTTVPDYLIRQAARTNYRELTVEELLGLGDTLDNLEHIGRLKQKLRTAQGLREYQEVKQEILDSIAQRPTKVRKMKSHTQEKAWLQETTIELIASFNKPEQIIEWLDAGNIQGPLMKYIFQPIVEAQTAKNDLNKDYNAKLADIFDAIPSGYLTEVFHIPGIKSDRNSTGTMTRQEIYAVALNMGNDSNRQKMLEGELWTEQQLAEITAHLKKEDWDRIQKVWNLLDSLWGRISALEKKLTGVSPPRVQGREFTNEHGTYAGGYYPVVYDFKTRRGLNILEDTTPVDKQRADNPFTQHFVRPGTNHKHTVKRTQVAKPIRLELAVLPGHIHSVIHDLTYREAVRAAYKIIWDPDIRRAIEDVESPAMYNQLKHWLKSVATEHALVPDGGSALIERVRTGATMYGMGFRITTALAQPLGFFPLATRVRPRHIAAGIAQMVRNPSKTLDFVNEKSGELRHRFNNQERDIKDTVRKLSLKNDPFDAVRFYAFHHIAIMDKFVAVAGFLGGYRQALEKGLSDEAAVQAAERDVRLTQGTGFVKDMAKIVNNGENMKIFTMFYSFFSAQYNMQADLTRKTIYDIRTNNWQTVMTEDLTKWAYLVVFPAIFGALLTGQGPDEDENVAAWAARKTLFYPFAAVPFLRDIMGPIETGWDYKVSPAGNVAVQLVRAGQQIMEGDPAGAFKPAITATAIWLKLPAGQSITTVEGLWEGLRNGDFEFSDLLFGRRDK